MLIDPELEHYRNGFNQLFSTELASIKGHLAFWSGVAFGENPYDMEDGAEPGSIAWTDNLCHKAWSDSWRGQSERQLLQTIAFAVKTLLMQSGTITDLHQPLAHWIEKYEDSGFPMPEGWPADECS